MDIISCSGHKGNKISWSVCLHEFLSLVFYFWLRHEATPQLPTTCWPLLADLLLTRENLPRANTPAYYFSASFRKESGNITLIPGYEALDVVSCYQLVEIELLDDVTLLSLTLKKYTELRSIWIQDKGSKNLAPPPLRLKRGALQLLIIKFFSKLHGWGWKATPTPIWVPRRGMGSKPS
jgi:hypothetical protein